MEINLTVVFVIIVTGILLNFILVAFLFKGMKSLKDVTCDKINHIEREYQQKLTHLETVIVNSIETQHANSNKESADIIKKSQEQFSDLVNKVKKTTVEVIEEQGEKRAKSETELTQALKNSVETVSASLVNSDKQLAKYQEQNQSNLTLLKQNLEHTKEQLIKLLNQIAFDEKQQQITRFEQLSKQLNTLRIDNIVDLTNELGKHNELQVDSEDFVKYLGDCKVLKIEDKHTGQITQVFYENGVKRSTETYSGDDIKYQMFYDSSGKAQRGLEFNEKGLVAFEYNYDAAGEVAKRIDFTYDESGNEESRHEVSY